MVLKPNLSHPNFKLIGIRDDKARANILLHLKDWGESTLWKPPLGHFWV
jgi:hypothetical protein